MSTYPKQFEDAQIRSECSLLDHLRRDRVHEALLSARSMENTSAAYASAIRPLLECPEVTREMHDLTLFHVRDCQMRQSLVFRLASRRLRDTPTTDPLRAHIAEILSLIAISQHRRMEVHRMLMVAYGGVLHREKREARDR